MATDELAQRRAKASPPRLPPFELECDGEGCTARGTFDSLEQSAAWSVQGVRGPIGEMVVRVHCPRCRARL